MKIILAFDLWWKWSLNLCCNDLCAPPKLVMLNAIMHCNDGADKDDENSDEKGDHNGAQATSEGCEDSYLEVARPRRSHHHWENRFQNHDNCHWQWLSRLLIESYQTHGKDRSGHCCSKHSWIPGQTWYQLNREGVNKLYFLTLFWKLSQVGFPLCHACI